MPERRGHLGVSRLPAVRRGLVGIGLAQTAASAATVAQAVLLARIVAGAFLQHQSVTQLAALLVLLPAVMAVRAVAAGIIEHIGTHVSIQARAGLRQDFLAAVARLGPRWLATANRDAVATTAGPGIESLDGYITRALPAAVAVGITPVIVLTVIGVRDWPSLLVLGATIPLAPIFLSLIGIMTKRHMDRQWATLARLAGQFLDLLEGLTTLKVYGRSRSQVEAVRQGAERYRLHTNSTLRVAFLSGFVLDLLATLSVALVAVTVGLRLDHGSIGLQAALTVLLLAPEVYAPLRAIGAQHHATQEARAVLASTWPIIDEAERITSPAPAASTRTRLDGVTVVHPERAAAALDSVHLEFEAGTITALTGPSGSGKTTLIDLLRGDLPAQQGTIEAGPAAWVPQRPRPTQATVADEIRLGDPALDDAGVERIVRLCATPAAGVEIGEAGLHVSAGQRRRLALARAVARAQRIAGSGLTPLVVLDEPTEDLDSATRQVVLHVLCGLRGWATVVAATHDPALVAVAEREVTLTDGRVTADRRFPPRLPAPVLVAAPADHRLPPAIVSPGRSNRQLWTALRRTPGAVRSLLWACFFGGLGGISALALTATSVWLICRAAEHPNVQALAVAAVGVRTFALSRAVLRYAERLAAHDGALRLLAEVRARVFSALEPLVPAGLADLRRGDLLRRFTTDIDGVQEALVRAVVPIAGSSATAVAAVVVAAVIYGPAGAILAAGLAVGGLAVPSLARRSGRDRGGVAAAGRRDGLVQGLIDGLPELAAYQATGGRLEDIAAADRDVYRAQRRAARAGAIGVSGSGLTGAATLAAVLTGAIAAAHGGRSLGVLAATCLVAFDAVGVLPGAFAALGRCLAGVARVQDVLSRPAPFPAPTDAAPLPVGIEAVAGSGFDLYPAPGAVPVLEGACFRVGAGERVALLGPSGSGKSTLLTAVLRLLPTSGAPIVVQHAGGIIPIGQFHPGDFPHLAAGSLQGDHIFSTTLRDNLRLVAPSASDEDLDAVAARVGLAAWIDSLPDRWSTQAGADGNRVSGGQRQRLLLARALLAHPDVLVLDEPTAHLDPDTASAVMADIVRSTAGRTLLLSTHRPHLLEQFDQVLSIDDGHLIAEGTAALVH